MWIWLSLCSAVLLGFYDTAKKQALKKNGVMWILLASTALTTVFLFAMDFAGLRFGLPVYKGSLNDHLKLVLKAALVTTSWVSGLAALKTLPLTTVSTIKASRPVFVIIFSIILFGEKLNLWQWAGIAAIFLSLLMLDRSSGKEGIRFSRNKAVWLMVVSVLTGAASGLYDKHIIKDMDPLFLQRWCNLYISALMALILLVQYSFKKEGFRKFNWDWTLLAIAVLITAADMTYFFALREEGAMLAVVSMVRRGSVLVSFASGAVLFKEKYIGSKAIDLAVMMVGLALLVFGS